MASFLKVMPESRRGETMRTTFGDLGDLSVAFLNCSDHIYIHRWALDLSLGKPKTC